MPRSSPPPSVKTSRDPALRRRILDTAKRHFTENGFKGARLDVIAAEARCSKGALYLEFADKEALLAEVVRETLASVGARYASEVLGLASPLARLRESLRFAYRESAAEPLFTRLMREDPDLAILRPAEGSENARAGEAQVAMLCGWVDEGIALGEIRPDVDRDAIPFVLGTLRFVPQHLGFVRSTGRFSGERVLDAVVDLFAAGLAARAPAPSAAAPRESGNEKSKTPTVRPRETKKKRKR